MLQNELEKQNKATTYYDKFSRVYAVFSLKIYYHKARSQAIKELRLSKRKSVLNVPDGTGQAKTAVHQGVLVQYFINGPDDGKTLILQARGIGSSALPCLNGYVQEVITIYECELIQACVLRCEATS